MRAQAVTQARGLAGKSSFLPGHWQGGGNAGSRLLVGMEQLHVGTAVSASDIGSALRLRAEPVGTREGLGLLRQETRLPADSGWVARRMDGSRAWGCLGKAAHLWWSQIRPLGMQADPPKGCFLSARPETSRSRSPRLM